MALVLTYGASVPVVKIARLAGQFAKPRSRRRKARGHRTAAYRGDAVNGFEFTPEARTPDPRRLLRAYHCSAATLNLCRAFTAGGYADLNQAHGWNRGLRPAKPVGPALRTARRRDRPRPGVHARLRRQSGRAAFGGALHQPRSPAPGLRAGPDQVAIPTAGGGTTLRALPVDRRAHPRPRGAHVDFAAGIRNPSGSSSALPPPKKRSWRSRRRSTPTGEPGRLTSSAGWARPGSVISCPR